MVTTHTHQSPHCALIGCNSHGEYRIKIKLICRFTKDRDQALISIEVNIYLPFLHRINDNLGNHRRLLLLTALVGGSRVTTHTLRHTTVSLVGVLFNYPNLLVLDFKTMQEQTILIYKI